MIANDEGRTRRALLAGLVMLGGGLAEAGDWLLAPLRRAAKKWGQPLASRQVRIMRTRLGADIGVLGAARCAMLKRRPASGRVRRKYCV